MVYNKQMNKNKGFTLIELLVTIAIIALLSSIIFASVSSVRDKANIKKTQVQAKEIRKAAELSRLSSGNLPFSNMDPDISIRTSESISSSLNEVSPGIEKTQTPSVSGYNSGDYYLFHDDSDNKAKVNLYGNTHEVTCKPSVFDAGGYFLFDKGSSYQEEEEKYVSMVENWTTDENVIAYKKYSKNYDPGDIYICTRPATGQPYFQGGQRVSMGTNILYKKVEEAFDMFVWEPLSICDYTFVCDPQ